MELQKQLQHIFHADFPGIDGFIETVIQPVIGTEIDTKNIDYLSRLPELKKQADNAGIAKITYVCDIDNPSEGIDNIVLFDVTLKDGVNVERARVNIQRAIRSIVESYSNILIVFHFADVEGKPWRFSYAYKQDTAANTTSAKRFTYVFGRDFRGRTAAERFAKLTSTERTTDDFIEAFSVEALSDEFFNRYREIYADFVAYMTGQRIRKEKGKWVEVSVSEPNEQFAITFNSDAKAVRDYIKKMFGRTEQ